MKFGLVDVWPPPPRFKNPTSVGAHTVYNSSWPPCDRRHFLALKDPSKGPHTDLTVKNRPAKNQLASISYWLNLSPSPSLFSLTSLMNRAVGAVNKHDGLSARVTDHHHMPIAILSIAQMSFAQLDGPSCLLKQPPGLHIWGLFH